MSDLLDKLDNALQEVEDQLLAEFDRIRKTLSGEAYSSIDAGVKNALNEIVMGLWHELEHSGDRNNLTLRTERHEALSVRMIVLKKLLDAKIPTAFLTEAEEQLARPQRKVEQTSAADTVDVEEEEEPLGFFATIMQFFMGKSRQDDALPGPATSNGVQAEEESIGVYLDSVYATSKYLAVIASHFQTEGDDKDMMNAAASGRAVFESHELSSSMPDMEEASSGLAQTPDAIRKKLESAGPRSSGASTFQSKDLSATMPTMPPVPVKPMVEKKPVVEKRDLAQTPEEIRKKLQARQGTSGSSGKASFNSKDIEPAGPQEVPQPRKKTAPVNQEPAKQAPAERPTGKAIFESKDLSSSSKDN